MLGKTSRYGNIRKRSDGRWEARYSIGVDSQTGKQIQKSIYGKTQKEVRQKLNKVTIEPSKMIVSAWLDE